MCGFCNPKETDNQRTIRMMTERQAHRDQVGSINALDNTPPDKPDIVTLVGRATGKPVNQRGTFSAMLPEFGKEERGPRPAALEELRQAAEILENMDGAGGLGDETNFLRLMSEALFMFDQDARQRMLRWLNSACA